MNNRKQPTELGSLRIDKWLWAARFFKTRSLAKSAVEKGRIKIGKTKIKPSRLIKTGDTLTIQQGYAIKTVSILRLEEQRKSASEAALLYKETEESIAARELAALTRQSSALATPRLTKKPTKKERRQIIEFNNTQQP